jgi:hypothetical protein
MQAKTRPKITSASLTDDDNIKALMKEAQITQTEMDHIVVFCQKRRKNKQGSREKCAFNPTCSQTSQHWHFKNPAKVHVRLREAQSYLRQHVLKPMIKENAINEAFRNKGRKVAKPRGQVAKKPQAPLQSTGGITAKPAVASAPSSVSQPTAHAHSQDVGESLTAEAPPIATQSHPKTQNHHLTPQITTSPSDL